MLEPLLLFYNAKKIIARTRLKPFEQIRLHTSAPHVKIYAKDFIFRAGDSINQII